MASSRCLFLFVLNFSDLLGDVFDPITHTYVHLRCVLKWLECHMRIWEQPQIPFLQDDLGLVIPSQPKLSHTRLLREYTEEG